MRIVHEVIDRIGGTWMRIFRGAGYGGGCCDGVGANGMALRQRGRARGSWRNGPD